MENFRPGEAVEDDNPLPVRVVSGGDSASLYSTPMGYEQINSGDLQAAKTLSPPGDSMMAVVQNNGGTAVRWRDDGVAPTTTIGMRLEVGGEQRFLGDLTAIAFRDEGTNAQLDVSYYG